MNINEYVECLNQAYDIKCPICGRKPSYELRSMKILYQKGANTMRYLIWLIKD